MDQTTSNTHQVNTHVSLAAYLADRDEACPSCNYNLRGLGSDRCPECNTELVLRVAMAEPRLGLFLATVVAWALGAGFSVLLILYAMVVIMNRPGSIPPLREFLAVPLGGTVVQGSAVIALLIFQKRIRRWSHGPRVILCVAGVACTLLNLGLFARYVN